MPLSHFDVINVMADALTEILPQNQGSYKSNTGVHTQHKYRVVRILETAAQF